ncbi:MAG: addiction module antidote protein [Thermoanaerobaculia bacterium]
MKARTTPKNRKTHAFAKAKKNSPTTRWDAADHLRTSAEMSAYLEAALEEGDAGLVAAALGDIARAQGMSGVARDAGLGRESLYKALSPEGNPELATVLRVVAALGLRLRAEPARP